MISPKGVYWVHIAFTCLRPYRHAALRVIDCRIVCVNCLFPAWELSVNLGPGPNIASETNGGQFDYKKYSTEKSLPAKIPTL